MVDIRVFGEVENVVRDRLKRTHNKIENSLAHIAAGNPLAAESDTTRRLDRLQTKASLSREEAMMISAAIDMAADRETAKPSAKAEKAPGPEAIRGATLDFVGVAFLERGRRAADAVGRIAFMNGGPQGTGFLVAPRLLLTNHHVIQSVAEAKRFQVQFDYEYDRYNRVRSPSAFFLDPDYCFITDGIEGLDYTLIGIGEQRAGERQLRDFGFLPLSDTGDKHMLGEIANVIQHPDGRYKEIVLRENHLVARDDTLEVLHYVADTEQGSSGSPVFNNEWEPIALHHWAGPFREVMGVSGKALMREINEGIRISAIVKDLRARRLAGKSAAAARQALALWDSIEKRGGNAVTTGGGEDLGPGQGYGASGSGMRQNADGSVTWTFPVEISVRAPLIAPPVIVSTVVDEVAIEERPRGLISAEAATWKTENFDDRGGYEPGFVPGSVIPLPDHSGAAWRAAKNQLALPGDDPHELRYHHFSLVMNAERRLAYFTAVNIDGSRIKAVNRDDKTVIDDPTLNELGVESIGFEGAEASDDFRPDRRILPEEQMNRTFYEKQIVAGFPDPQSKERIARIFQKGHIILRGDPAWGTDTEALAAERDTFFYTNAAPQVGFFNQGSALNRPGSKGKLRWRAVETYVLRNAVTMKSRVSVFAGPVFDDATDPPYRFEAQVPMRFWKIALWNDGDALRSIALLADQRPVIEVMPEAIVGQPEAFGDEDELARVSEFLTTVTEIEALTGLDFGANVREADIRAGSETTRRRPAQTLEPGDLTKKSKRPKANAKTKTAAAKASKTPAKKAAKRPSKKVAAAKISKAPAKKAVKKPARRKAAKKR
ncbi:MAG TPA: DNA/RNA non-specific endonuclease [Rhizobiaceae bacterium]|nr:DNA/RNA non-specific endonuclease [Rhizobiaceae bacterium]